ncbi:hypothetical protein [Chamaesiphon sp. VAR_48_metabat_135_sub]|uniref:hypothetical protein n=1 Tax=Chamaesiphon sp. VAR_48_metabat_135_sub TaxID=2964699 RepID=UPI00286C8C97|nr:hypothetical protein [Chamaesiphon sp. VAR_48_metabat_135_sub]
MKQIKVAMLVVVSIGCLFPTVVRAEAPTPKGGCWSREIVMRPIDNPQTMTTIRGRVVAIEHGKNQQIVQKELATWLRVKTATGEENSIYLGSSQYLKQLRLNIQVRDSVEIQGIQMPKSRQLPTVIASTVKKGERVWKIDSFINKPTGVKSCRYRG